MEYQILSQEEQDDIIVSFMLGQERDKYCHELNLERYTEMLKTSKAGEWHDRLLKLRNETASRLVEVNNIISVTVSQMPPQERIDATKLRIKKAMGNNK